MGLTAIFILLGLTRAVKNYNNMLDVKLLHPKDKKRLERAKNTFYRNTVIDTILTAIPGSIFFKGSKDSYNALRSIKATGGIKAVTKGVKNTFNMIKRPVGIIIGTDIGVSTLIPKKNIDIPKKNIDIPKKNIDIPIKMEGTSDVFNDFYKNNTKKINALGVGLGTGAVSKISGLSTPVSIAIGLGGASLRGLYDNRKLIKKYFNK